MTRFQSNLQIGKRLGAGHFGEVFDGSDDIHGRVAVKIFRQGNGEPDAVWQRRKTDLLNEGQRLEAASHSNVVRVYNVVESPASDAVHLVMECCAGGSLEGPYEKGPMSLFDVRRVATDVALGLQALHARGMLHRDIKPGNLLLGPRGTAKIGDFGLVTDNVILGYASQKGYGDHVAYEVWGGKGTSIKSDIWAFGMTIYRLLHGKEWYSRNPPPKDVIQDGGFADALPWLPHIPSSWQRFIRKSMEDDPSIRYQSTTQVINALAKLPIEPRWDCAVSATEVRWKRKAANRRIEVIWNQHSRRTHTWKAWSEPIAKGNRRSLGESSKKIGGAEAIRQLRSFFVKQF